MERNRLSDKFNRRDTAFYKLYVQRESGEEMSNLKDNQFPLEIGAAELYKDIEMRNFLDLAYEEDLVEKNFGKTITVQISLNPKTGDGKREVRENKELVREGVEADWEEEEELKVQAMLKHD